MILEDIRHFEKNSLKTYVTLSGIYYKPRFFSVLFLSSILLTLLTVPAFAIRLINVKPIFEIQGQFNKPSDVSVSPEGLIYVVDGVNNKIKIFNRNGKFLSSFGSKGSKSGEFSFPLGIDIDSSGKVYIADSGNHRVQIFDARGGYIAELRISPGNSHPADPTDVVVDESINRCYIVDNDNHHVLAYDLSNRKLIRAYGSQGSGEAEFRYPFFIALGREKRLYVVDVINTRVQVVNSEGLFVASIGGWGVEKGEFFRPKGVAVDKHNRVYVGDSYMGVIQVFESTGEFSGALGDPISGKVKKFRTPTGLFVDNQDRLYVVEMLANKVSVYHLEGRSQ